MLLTSVTESLHEREGELSSKYRQMNNANLGDLTECTSGTVNKLCISQSCFTN